MDQDVPNLEAWIDTDDGDDQLHIRVQGADGTVHDEIDADLEILRGLEQYVSEFGRPALTLLTLRDRIVREERAEPPETEADEMVAGEDIAGP